jgi:hypothetical protein
MFPADGYIGRGFVCTKAAHAADTDTTFSIFAFAACPRVFRGSARDSNPGFGCERADLRSFVTGTNHRCCSHSRGREFPCHVGHRPRVVSDAVATFHRRPRPRGHSLVRVAVVGDSWLAAKASRRGQTPTLTPSPPRRRGRHDVGGRPRVRRRCSQAAPPTWPQSRPCRVCGGRRTPIAD